MRESSWVDPYLNENDRRQKAGKRGLTVASYVKTFVGSKWSGKTERSMHRTLQHKLENAECWMGVSQGRRNAYYRYHVDGGHYPED